MEEAADRAYEITSNHLVGHIERLELEAGDMAAAVEKCLTLYEEQQHDHRMALAKVEAEKVALEHRLQTATEEIQLVRDERDGYMEEMYDAESRLEVAEAELDTLRNALEKLQERSKAADEALHMVTFEKNELRDQLLKNEGSLTADEEAALKESTKTAQLALEEEKSRRAVLEREVEALRLEQSRQREEGESVDWWIRGRCCSASWV